MAGTDDLAPLMAGGGRPHLPYAQGVITSWNPDTFENVVEVYGDEHVDLPVKSSVEALTYQAGDTVILARWPGSRGSNSTWWIDGRAVIPGTGRGEEAIAFMTTALGAAVARSVIGQSVLFDVRAGTGFRDAFSTFGDVGLIAPFTPGPEVSFQLEGESFLAIWGAQVTTSAFQDDVKAAFMDVVVDGPTPYTPPNSPTNPNAAFLENHVTVEPPDFVGISGSTMNARRFEADPGSYTITAKYRFDESNTPPLNSLGWRQRFLIVIVF